MPVQVVQNTFNSGELSPQMLGRSDLPYFQHGVQTLENFLIRPQGGILKRSGTRFVQECEDSAVKGRVVPFVFSTTQAYILEFCDLKIRFYRDEANIRETGQNITNVTQANPAVVTINAHGYSSGDEIYIQNVGGMTEINNRFFIAAGVAANTFQLSGEDSTGHTAYTSGGTAECVHEVTTTYTEAQLPYLRFAQSADVLYIVHEAHAPATLTRTAHTSWALTDLDFIDGPYLEMRVQEVGDTMEDDTLTLDPDAASGNVTLTAAANVFEDPRDDDRMIRWGKNDGTDWGGLRVTVVTDATHADADIVAGILPVEQPPTIEAAHAASRYWHFGAYYPANYPRTVGFFEGRLALAGTPLEPERFDASVTGGWNDFALTSRVDDDVNADNGISYQLGGANDVQVIRWLATIRNLVIGTTGGIWPVQASSSNEAVTPTNINLPRSSAFGCANIQPVTAYDTVVYVSRTNKKILAAGYNYEPDAYRTEDLTIMAEHVTGTGIDFLEYQQEPHSIVWALRGDGQLAGMTYEQGQKVHGWHRHIIGGVFGTGDAVVESIAVIPSPNADHDQVWMIVKRTINGSTVRHIEFMEQDFADSDDGEDAFFLDSGITYDGAPTDTFSNADHLEGETVQVLADGAVHPDVTIASGAFTLNYDASVVHVGYSYNANCETLPLEMTDRRGTTAGRTKRPTHAIVRLHRTLGFEHGPDSSNLTRVPFRSAGDPMDAPPPFFTGLKELTLTHGHDNDPVLYLRQPDPLPAVILSVAGSTGVSPR